MRAGMLITSLIFTRRCEKHGMNIAFVSVSVVLKVLRLHINQKEVFLVVVGYVSGIEAESVGKAALVLGAGRETKESTIDLAVGIVIHKKIGDAVIKGESVATIYYNDLAKCEAAEAILKSAYTLSASKAKAQTLIYDIIEA